MARLDRQQTESIKSIVRELTRTLTTDIGRLLEGRYGIRPDGTVEPIERLSLDDADASVRDDLEGILAHFGSEGDVGPMGRQRLIREAVFTHVNRLIAIRIAEEIGLLPESLANGRKSAGFRDLVADVAPPLSGDDSGGYWFYLGLCGDELAADVPALFDPRNPLLALAPSAQALDVLVDELGPARTNSAGESIWAADDTLGWAYQFFNDEDERREMRKATAPRSSRELAVRNQFFTPEYVVRYLVHNSLGRRLAEADLELVPDLDWLVDPPTAPGPPLELGSARVLDPACGSGHFLLSAYDLLELAWARQGRAGADAAPDVLGALWGIDIDPRAAQVAATALVFRARKACGPGAPLPRPNVMCARVLPPVPDEIVTLLPASDRLVLNELRDELDRAPLLGSLLKVEHVLGLERIAGTARRPHRGMAVLPASEDAARELAVTRDAVLELVGRAADVATSSPAERLTAAEADDALRFVQALSQTYDVVLMNPPFGAPAVGTKDYLKSAYPSASTSADLFSVFVERGLELCNDDGYLGAITSRVGFFLSSFEQWRDAIVYGAGLITVADLGEGVMHDAMVEAAAYVVRRQRSGQPTTVFRVVAQAADERGSVLEALIESARSGLGDDRIFTIAADSAGVLPQRPFVYWVDPAALESLTEFGSFEPSNGIVRVGLQTSDDFRFVRAWWEVPAGNLLRPPAEAGGLDARTQLSRGARWAPIVKGGSSQPWFSPNELVVDWEDDGSRIRNFMDDEGKVLSRPQNTDVYFRPGFSWTRRAPRLVPYVVPAGCIPSVSRYQAFPNEDPYTAIGLAASNVATAFCRFYGEKFLWPNMLVDNVKSLPTPDLRPIAQALGELVRDAVAERRAAYSGVEPYREFVAPVESPPSREWDRRTLLGRAQDVAVAECYGLTSPEFDALDRDLQEALHQLGQAGAAEDEEDADDLPEVDWPRDVLSYLVGCAFGRWDVRIGSGERPAPALPDVFDPMPTCPPGSLVDDRGLPIVDAPADYPLRVPLDGVLIDEIGHPLDIGVRLEDAASAYRAGSSLLEDVTADLGADLRAYLRGRFFKDHLKRYSKSRRKAPIYWPLYVPSKSWGVWVYAPRLSREALFAVDAAADQRLGSAITEIRRLEAEQLEAGGRSSREATRRLEAERKLAEELRLFQREARRVADLGWQPDLDDGIALCAAPLADLFPDWRADLVARRTEIKRGAYPWSTIGQFGDVL